MFRIDVSGEGGNRTMKIAGRLGTQCAEELKRQALRCRDPHRLVVDLSEVTFIDDSGEEVMSWLAQMGAQFIAQGLYCLDICERLYLPMLKACATRRRLRGAVI